MKPTSPSKEIETFLARARGFTQGHPGSQLSTGGLFLLTKVLIVEDDQEIVGLFGEILLTEGLRGDRRVRLRGLSAHLRAVAGPVLLDIVSVPKTDATCFRRDPL